MKWVALGITITLAWGCRWLAHNVEYLKGDDHENETGEHDRFRNAGRGMFSLR
jgi:hypothetical protein